MDFHNLLVKNVYSAEAKKLIAYSLLHNNSFAVSKKIKIIPSIKETLFYDVVELGWGKEYLPFITIEYSDNPSKDNLDFVESKITNQRSLFVFHLNSDSLDPSVTVSINHALADDYTLKILDDIITEYMYYGSYSKLKKRLISGQEEYQKYVDYQSRYREEYYKNKDLQQVFLEPIKFKKAMIWDRNFRWNSLILEMDTLRKNNSLETILEILKSEDYVVGDVASVSQNWRKDKYSNALGMMTGLLPYSVSAKQKLDIATSLELLASCDRAYNEFLSICYESDLYFSRSMHLIGHFEGRGSRFRFPVGVTIDSFKRIIQVEGCFCFPEEVRKIFEEIKEREL
ncbi:hypothetical protein [Streptococcus sp. S784/96/1]|uniref:hypothetical protein n=1 Tax=Streptococcus sp. S784/96/1 TaxID=2653499 RepID=UPI00138949B5|nr:hypothetical protein [Streptococcus sp. S784/96/1]